MWTQSEDNGFEFWPGHRLSRLKVCSSCSSVPEIIFAETNRWSHGHLLPNPFQFIASIYNNINTIPTPWPESASELYRQISSRLSAKLVTTSADRRATWSVWWIPYGRVLDFIDRSYFFFHVAPQLYSRGWVDPVPDSLLLRKSGSAGDRIWTSGSVARNFDH
jgi:hypothetical protein